MIVDTQTGEILDLSPLKARRHTRKSLFQRSPYKALEQDLMIAVALGFLVMLFIFV